MPIIGNYHIGEIIHSTLITFASFLLFCLSLGVAQSFGIVYHYLLDEFNESKSETSWISSLGGGLMLAFSPIAGVIEKKYGLRFTAVLGSVLASTGLMVSYFVTSMYVLYFTYGILSGVGFSLMFNSTNNVVNLYFNKRRSLAAGISTSGISFGTIILPITETYLLQSYGWRGTFLLLSGIVLHCICSGMLFGDLKSSSQESLKEELNLKKENKNKGHVHWILSEIKEIYQSKQFVIFSLSSASAAMFYFVPFIMLPDMVTDYGISEESAALMIAVSGITDILSRIVFGYVSSFTVVNRFLLNGLALIILGISTALCYLIKTEHLFYIYTSVVGITTGIFGIFQALIVYDILGREKLEIGFGCFFFLNGITTTAGPPIAGLISDRTSSYKLAFLCGGLVFITGGVLSILASYYDRWCSSKGTYNLRTAYI